MHDTIRYQLAWLAVNQTVEIPIMNAKAEFLPGFWELLEIRVEEGASTAD